MPDTEEIRSICRKIIGEMLDDFQPRPILLSEKDDETESKQEDDIDLGSIAEALDGFRKK